MLVADGIADQRIGGRRRIDEESRPAARLADRAARKPLAGKREIRLAGEIAGIDFGAVDDEARFEAPRSAASTFFAPETTRVASQNRGRRRRPRRELRRISSRLSRQFDMAVDRAALLREAGHVDHAAAVALEMRGHAEESADRHDTRAADAGDDDRIGLVANLPRGRLGERRRRRRGRRSSSVARHAR